MGMLLADNKKGVVFMPHLLLEFFNVHENVYLIVLDVEQSGLSGSGVRAVTVKWKSTYPFDISCAVQ